MSNAIYLVSDLHMGDGRIPMDGYPRDNFLYKNKYEKFRAFLEHVRKEDAELFILGDLLEFWLADLDMVITNNWDMLTLLNEMKVTYIPGNHDIDLTAFYNAKGDKRQFPNHPFFKNPQRIKTDFERIIGGKRFIFRHGHEGDGYNDKNYPVVGRMVTILAGLAEDELSRYFDKDQQALAVEPALSVMGQFLVSWLIKPWIARLRNTAGRNLRSGVKDAAGMVTWQKEQLEIAGENGLSEYEQRLLLQNMVLNELFAGIADELVDDVSSSAMDEELCGANKALGEGWIKKKIMELLAREFAKWVETQSKSKQMLGGHLHSMHKLWEGFKDPDATLVVGHTHLPGICRITPDAAGKIWYYNTGSWSDTGHDVMHMDASGNITYHTWENTGLRPKKKVDDYSSLLAAELP